MATSIESVLVAAARNNAEWCALMSRTHGVAGEFDEQAWAAAARTPPYYPDAVTLMPDCDPDALMARIDTALPSASVKDSFADLDLTGSGFEVLFDAQWIHRAATKPFVRSDLEWSVVVDAGALGRWALAWDDGKGNEGVFQPQLLDDPDTFVVAGYHVGGAVCGGAVAYRGAGVVGVSNVFAEDQNPDTAWPLVLSAVHSLFPMVPVVGYEHGDDLEAAARHGFEILGPLRVWTQTARD
ncbi:MAG TPA: hypothetical protein VFX33_03565 [Actinomycetales bacterium]|nr:hypothetical protein [Actinomycetales bacterium]